MAITKIHSLLVHPSKGSDDAPEIGGTTVPLTGKLGELLTSVYDRAPAECDIDIVFTPDETGRQSNECRDALVSYSAKPAIATARRVAERLQAVTTHRSGLGLLFLMSGQEDSVIRLVISRFPADQGIVAEEKRDRLSVEFLERIFMKSARSYKAAVYEGTSLSRGFWSGRAIDRQISGPKELSDYWIRDFLRSELRTTSAAGTKRLAVALRTAIRSSDELQIRQELVAAASLMRNRDGEVTSGRALVGDLRLSPAAAETLDRHVPRPELMSETFQFDGAEFDRHVQYRAVELDNGGLLLAEDDDFDEVFRTEPVDDAGIVRFTTEGRVVNESLRNRK